MSLAIPSRTPFLCSSCTKSLYRAVVSSHTSLPQAYEFATQLYQRAPHSTYASIRKGHHVRALNRAIEADAKGKNLPWSPKRHRKGPVTWERKSLRAQASNRGHLDALKPEGAKYDLFSELEWTRDPLDIANIVRRGLRDGQRDQALEICRIAFTRGIRNVVSWNYMIDYHMERGEPKLAMTVYKEMKERGCKPDAHTYTIALRGLARNADKSDRKFNIVQQAMKVYDHLITKKSGVRPTNIHSNALLHVCARVGDMDAVWKAAGIFSESGQGAPDAKTYTTILDALLHASEPPDTDTSKDGDLSSHAADARKKLASSTVADAEGVWQDVMYRWQNGELVMDESLVNGIARIYLHSESKADQEKIFRLVEDTMNIRVAQLSSRSTQGSRASSDAFGSIESSTDVSGNVPLGGQSSALMSRTPEYVAPTQKTLSLLMMACAELRLRKPATHYWALLTSTNGPYKLQPDVANVLDYLRLLRVSRASEEVANVVKQLAERPFGAFNSSAWSPGIFSVAISTCKRDIWNPNCFKNATQMIDTMTKVFPAGPAQKPLPAIIHSYLEVAIGPDPISKDAEVSSGQYRPIFSASARNLVEASKRIIPYVEHYTGNNSESVRLIAQDAVSAYDRLLKDTKARQEIGPELSQALEASRRTFTSLESRALKKEKEMERASLREVQPPSDQQPQHHPSIRTTNEAEAEVEAEAETLSALISKARET